MNARSSPARDQIEIAVTATYKDDGLARELVEESPELATAAAAVEAHPSETGEERRHLDELTSRVVGAKRADDRAALVDTLAPLAVEIASTEAPRGRTVLNAVFVVTRERAPEFDAALETFRERHVDRLEVTVVRRGP
jgi:hypothetical protein